MTAVAIDALARANLHSRHQYDVRFRPSMLLLAAWKINWTEI
jgi:hypothetical protein